MSNRFLQADYTALALIEAKNKIFHENFITLSEFNQFNLSLQQEFHNRSLNVVITSGISGFLSKNDFTIINGISMPSDECSCNIDRLSTDISTVLRDSEFITNFLIQQESDKLKVLEQVQQKNAKPYMKANGHPI